MKVWKQELAVSLTPKRFTDKIDLTEYINYCIKYNVTKNCKCVLKQPNQRAIYFTLVTENGKATYPSTLNLTGITEEETRICN